MIEQTTLFPMSPRERALAAFEIEEGRWLDKIRAAAIALHHATGRPICSDDLRALMANYPTLLPPPDRSMNIMGSVFRRGFRCVGRTTSQMEQAHENEVRLWIPEKAA